VICGEWRVERVGHAERSEASESVVAIPADQLCREFSFVLRCGELESALSAVRLQIGHFLDLFSLCGPLRLCGF
jgi:hypothetical protein